MRQRAPVGERERQLLVEARPTVALQGTAVSRMVESLQRKAGNQAVVQLLQQKKGQGAAGKLDLDDQTGIPVEGVEWGTKTKLQEVGVGMSRFPTVIEGPTTSDPISLTRVTDEHSAALSAGSTFATGALHLANKGGGGTIKMRKVVVSQYAFGQGREQVELTYDHSAITAKGTPMRASKGTLHAGSAKVGVLSWKLDDTGLTVLLRKGGDAGMFEDAMTNHMRYMDVSVVPRGKGGTPTTLPLESLVTEVRLVSAKGIPSFQVTFHSPSWAKAHKKDVVAPSNN